MVIEKFPDVELADKHGLLAVGGDLAVDSLLLAYRQGIFPWPVNSEHLTWFAPPKRAILKFSNFHIPKSLRRERNRAWASFAINKNFSEIIKNCQKLTNRTGQNGTWITEPMLTAYIDLHKAGHAHSFECYRAGELVGGIYGVSVGGVFAAESMFYRYPNASKLTLWFLVEYLSVLGLTWIDIQVMTELLKKFGATNLKRAEFGKLLAESLGLDIQIFSSESCNIAKEKLETSWKFLT